MASLIGGLQSSSNPGRVTTPGMPTYRRSRRFLSMGGSTGWGNNHGWGSGVTPGAPPPPYTPPPTGMGATGTAPGTWRNPWADPTHRGDPNWQIHQAQHNAAPTGPYVPPGAHALPLPAAPASSLMTYDQFLAQQPGWIAQQALDIANRNHLLAQYGFYDAGGGHLIADPKAAQDSLYAQLGNQQARQIGNVAQAGANHGNLFSGASLMGVQNASDAYKQGVSKALGDLTGHLGNITQGEIDLKNKLQPDYTDYVGNTKTSSPEQFLASIRAGKSNADNVATIDAYVTKYGKFLTPAQKQALAAERNHQVTLYKQHSAKPKTTPPNKRRRRKRHPAPVARGTVTSRTLG